MKKKLQNYKEIILAGVLEECNLDCGFESAFEVWQVLVKQRNNIINEEFTDPNTIKVYDELIKEFRDMNSTDFEKHIEKIAEV